MLIQRRERAIRLIRQHDHALLSGVLAFAWRAGTGRGPGWRTALATALHDAVWLEEDRRPRFDPGTGMPHDFTTVSASHKRDLVDSGLRRLRAAEPEVAALVQEHHASLAESTQVDPGSELAWLRFFDNLSLFACLTPPGSLVAAHPPWLNSAALRPPDGGSLTATWRNGDELVLSPFPFGSSFIAAEVAYRDLPSGRFADDAALQDAWDRAATRRWRLTLSDGGRPT
jgi:hypothetical protein